MTRFRGLLRPPDTRLFLALFRLWLVALAAIAGSARASNAIILINPDNAHVQGIPFQHSNWILWPEGGQGNSPLLSLMSGMDWAGDRRDFSFTSAGKDAWKLDNYESLAARGYFTARDRKLGSIRTLLLKSQKRGVSSLALLLAASGPAVAILPEDPSQPSRDLMITEARSWDDITSVELQVKGRVLVVEYPPDRRQTWTRFWLRGTGWPKGQAGNQAEVPLFAAVGVPGLVRARDLIDLFDRQNEVTWVPDSAVQGGTADAWLEHARTVAPFLLASWYWFFAMIIAIAMVIIASDDWGPLARFLLAGVALTPSALIVEGLLAHWGGVDAWWMWWTITFPLVGLGAWIVQSVLRKRLPSLHPLTGIAVLNCVALVVGNPVWTEVSPVFSPRSPFPGELLGALAASLTFALCQTAPRIGPRILPWMAASVLIASAMFASPWWAGPNKEFTLIPLIVVFAAEGRLAWPLLFVTTCLPSTWLPILRHGATFTFTGLIESSRQWQAVDFGTGIDFLFSPSFLATLLISGAILLMSNEYARYRIRKLIQSDDRRKTLGWTAAALVSLALTAPIAWHAAQFVFLSWILVLVYDALGE